MIMCKTFAKKLKSEKSLLSLSVKIKASEYFTLESFCFYPSTFLSGMNIFD